jgi:acyl-coenzyme A synthetase/AMP-(fatty) acid ligase
MGPQDKVLHFASINFDLAHEYWLMPLLFGAQLLITEPTLWSPAQACTQMARHGITVAAFPPSYLVQLAEAAHTMAQYPEPDTPPLSLRILAFGGEALSREHFERVRQVFAPATLINGYGPTETVISPMLWTTTPHSDPAQWQHSPYLPIGTAVGARSAWVLDDNLNPLPVGVAGELYLGGYALARGYHQRPGLSAERFVPDPWGQGSRLYRTGDRARWRTDGGMDYLGRLDHQVKLRGQRIELGEIEARLLACAGVREAAVLVHGEGASAQLLGYWVAQQSPATPAANAELLRQQLVQQLPDYMVPAQLIELDALPVTANGKLDRRALSQRVPQPAGQQRVYRAPQTPMEVQLAAIWAQVLKVERVGVDDGFFALGGHSLLATQVCARVRAQCAVDLSLAVFFEHPVLADMAAVLARDTGAAQQSEAQDLMDMQALLEALES